ncbi:acyl-CoA dehydrogenase family protein [Mycolicibacterium sp. ELW1]|uniref:acyl-CoA dehydrogenase family protein n=1 Tax=Mycobacteriaceae TaxID=1762 RepID=UPI0011ED793D|nr:acyl-CoA dehydrogenase family protein [Mycobacterium sp. ELW1]QEN12909.1 acyl-CoA dehydrogenase [Mycobacterium sp. ELW1]
MDFCLSDEQRMLVDSTRQLIGRLSPISRVRDIADQEGPGYDPRVWQAGGELGWSALPIPEDYGGLGRDLIDVALIAEEHGRAVQPGPLVSNAIVAEAISRSDNDDLRARVLPPLAAGEAVGTWAFAEPRQSWEAGGVHATAVHTADGYRLSGLKTAVQDADGARWILVTARLNGHLGQFLVERDTPGLSVRRQRTIDITRRFDEVRFDDVVLPASALVTAPAQAAAIGRQLRCGSVLICADSLGLASAVLDMTVEYAQFRVQFGRPVGSFQAVKHKCATMRMWLQASTAATYYAAMAVAADADDAWEATSAAKAYVGTAVANLTSEALQIHGGIGFTWEHDLHLYHRRAKANQVLFGDPFLHHERLAAIVEASVAS